MIVTFIGLFIIFLITTSVDSTEEDKELKEYCHMVETHKRDKSVGWPDFKGIYKEACVDQKGEQK
jgi:hypothetical protein